MGTAEGAARHVSTRKLALRPPRGMRPANHQGLALPRRRVMAAIGAGHSMIADMAPGLIEFDGRPPKRRLSATLAYSKWRALPAVTRKRRCMECHVAAKRAAKPCQSADPGTANEPEARCGGEARLRAMSGIHGAR